MAKKQRKPISHVKRVKLAQQHNPVSKEKYKRRLRVARRKDFWRTFWIIILVLIGLLVAGFFAGNKYMEMKTGENIFTCAAEAKAIAENSTPADFKLAETSYIYSDDGTQLVELSEADDATYLTYDEIPTTVVNAFVAVEDRTFWTNNGIDLKGIARVCLNYVKTRGEVAEGASTITQQLARTVYLTQEKTMLRKIKEIFLARELTKKYTKEQIMEFYCNTCCFANGIYGVEDASQTYFGKSVKELDLSQIAYICAIPNRPEYYNPLKESQNAIERRNKILNDMLSCGYITQNACETALAEDIQVYTVEEDNQFYNYEVTYAINCAVRYFMKLDGFEFKYQFDTDDEYNSYNELYDEFYAQAKHKLYTGGYKIYTTINEEAQSQLQTILDDTLAFSETTVEDTGIYELQGAMTVIDNVSGKVIAMIGGRSQDSLKQTYSLNRGFQGFAQPGSSFKPLAVYTPALNDGYDDGSLLTDIDVDVAKNSTTDEIKEMYGTQMTLRESVERSENGCAYWLFNELTPQVGLNYVTNMHFKKIVPEDYTLSAALGGLTYGVSTEEMANAYSALENHGEYTQTDCIDSILDSNGVEIYEEPESTEIYSREAADTMTDVMEGVISNGTARSMNWSSETDTEAAGKTGTTNDNKAGWFCGYTPYYTIAVWVGCDTPKTVDNLQGATYPASIWKASMLSLIQDKDTAYFDLWATHSSTSSYDYGLNDEDIGEIVEEVQQPAEEQTETQTDTQTQTQDQTTEDITGADVDIPQDDTTTPTDPNAGGGTDPAQQATDQTQTGQ